MSLSALLGAVGFLTRLPVPDRGRETGWSAFRSNPWAFPAVGYLLGCLLAIPFLLPLPTVTVALVFPAWLYVLTGITHLDGVADMGDAAAVHGDVERRRAVMDDPAVGTGGTLAATLVVLGTAAAAVAIAGLPLVTAVGLVIAAEVGAKLGMATLACFADGSQEGLGSAVLSNSVPHDWWPALGLSLPAAALTAPHPAAAVVVLVGPVVADGCRRWANRTLGGASGDVFGATNEFARVIGLHLGVTVWLVA